jgi:hypothetical protein
MEKTEYTLVDCSTDLVYGPYETLNQALSHAEVFAHWEIIDGDCNLVGWCTPRKTNYQKYLVELARFIPSTTVQLTPTTTLEVRPDGHRLLITEERLK